MEPLHVTSKGLALTSSKLCSIVLCSFQRRIVRILLGRSIMHSVIFAKTTGGIYCG